MSVVFFCLSAFNVLIKAFSNYVYSWSVLRASNKHNRDLQWIYNYVYLVCVFDCLGKVHYTFKLIKKVYF